MKKRTTEEKKQMIDEACDLFQDAAKKIEEAKRLLHLCGIDCCGGFDEDEVDEALGGCNVQLGKGIKRLGAIVGEEPYFRDSYSTEKPDKSRMLVRYKDLVFLQVGQEVTSKTAKFTYR